MCTRRAGNPVDLWNGREFFTHTDLVLPGLMDITIRRSHDSKAEYDSALGYGWALSYFMRLYEYADGSVILRRDCGVRRSFFYEAGAYQTPVGESGTLVKNGDGSWTYWEKSGDSKEFDTEGRLTAIVSARGPRLAFTYDSRGKLPLIGLSPYAVEPATPREIAQEFRLVQIDEQDASGLATGRWVSLTYNEDTGRISTITDSAGRTVQYFHDDIGNLVQVVLPENGIQDYAYEDPNDPHNATTLAHRGCSSCGTGTTVNTYDSEDRVVRQEKGSHVITISYDIPYVQTAYTEETYDDQGALLHTATYTIEFNEFGNPVVETDPLGNQTVYVRNSRMNIARKEIWEEQGGADLELVYAEEKTYNAQGSVMTHTEAAGFAEERTTTYAYDEYGRLSSITVPSVVDPQQSKVTSFTYDANDNLLARTEQGLLGNGTSFAYTTNYTYNGNGQPEAVDGPRTDVTDVTTYAYDTQGNLSSVTQPLNLVTNYSDYTETGQPQTVTDPNGVPTTYTYDSLGRVTSVTVDGDTTSYIYTPTGKIEQITLPRQNTMTYAYDSQDRLTTITDGLGNTINYTYDSSGNRLKEEIKDPEGVLTKTVAFQYDVLGRLYRINNPDGNYAEYFYDALGNQLSYRDPKGNPLTYYDYDPLGRLKKVIQPGDIHTLYGYSSHNNLISVTDGNGNPTTYTFDDMGRVYQETSPDRGTITYYYDAAGNIITKKDAKDITINYQYDAINRLTLIDFPTDTDIVYTYDTCTNGKGKLCQVQDQAAATTYAYSLKGELIQEDRLILGVNYTTGYQYNDNGNLEVLTYPSGRTVTYVHDNADQITDVLTTPPGGTQQTVASSISYYPFGGVWSLTYGNGLVRNVGFDLQYRVTSIQSGTIQDLTYVPDPNGNIQNIIDNLDSNKNKSFSYDSLDRLEGASGAWGDLSWTYDNAGNRLTYTDAGGTASYSYYTGSSRLESLSGAAISSFTYDANGNTETEDGRQFTYNENNRLVQVTDGLVLGAYTYNDAGQRVTATKQGQTTVFHYALWRSLLSESVDSSFNDYVYLYYQPIAKGTGTEIYFVHTDHLATPRVMTDETQATVWSLDARPFGDEQTIEGDEVLNVRFPGQYYDEETGLSYNDFRDYNADLGRYVESDPIGLVGGINPYIYARANPLVVFDPTGRVVVVAPVLAWLAAGGGTQVLAWGGALAAAAGIGIMLGEEYDPPIDVFPPREKPPSQSPPAAEPGPNAPPRTTPRPSEAVPEPAPAPEQTIPTTKVPEPPPICVEPPPENPCVQFVICWKAAKGLGKKLLCLPLLLACMGSF